MAESIYLSSCNKLAKVSIIGAGNVGRTLSQRLIERNLADVCLLDIVEGLPQGIALDLTEAQGLQSHHCEIMGTNDYADTKDSDIVVITAGVARKPGMSRDDLLKINAKIVTEATQKSLHYSPDAIYLVVTNPLDVMTYLVWKTSGLPHERVMGMAGVLDSARLETFIAFELGVSIHDVQGMVLGGHGDLMLPIPRYCTVSGIPITELLSPETIDKLIQRTRDGGAEIVRLLKTGSAYYAPASSACYMIESILFNQSRLLTAAAYVQGEYGLNDLFLGVPCRLGSNGIEQILEIKLTTEEREILQKSAKAVRSSINMALSK
ncbi:malate dehydrogenase [Cyanobacterium stanieri LEGE 03274]|uniref:Malate dehydrogenase n=1 Tax=Cyanobacterium stanieri LEGE 03274 TaxID=1828756 RepID=A0ABR9V1V0_9CHRO|nr:malate dehydrogenase [Cyanobacterium stanieri]MBE9221521.1 malate dehydrogenase [Cyanobacterium stanieri LEGE 03274]